MISLKSTPTLLLVSLLLIQTSYPMERNSWDYLIIGAGPAGLQLGYFMEQANRDYMIIEASDKAGSFFEKYPRHDKLISINKRHTGRVNKEFNLRHDWNSLISDDEKSDKFGHYSKDFFPNRHVYVKYLNDFAKNHSLHINYKTNITNVEKVNAGNGLNEDIFQLEDSKGNLYFCKYLIVATGLWKPNRIWFEGIEHTESYEDISTIPEDYEDQAVLVIGKRNSALETASAIYGQTRFVHLLARGRIRHSWETHYVGDLRAVNNEILDAYHLKSLDAVIEADIESLKVVKHKGKLYITEAGKTIQDVTSYEENFALREAYDRVIRCLGWKFDLAIFGKSINISSSSKETENKKFPFITHDYQAFGTENLYIAGTATHSLDFRKSAGGFIHGFRYTTRVLHHILEWRNHRKTWPSVTLHVTDLLNYVIKRINEASGIYQMFSVLGDVIVFRRSTNTIEYYEEYPLNLIHKFDDITGVKGHEIIVISMEYGANFSGPGKDVFSEQRATSAPSEAHKSNFLHPVFYYYKQKPSATSLANREPWEVLPKPYRKHFTVEDFLTEWMAYRPHILPIMQFFESCWGQTLSSFFIDDCLIQLMTNKKGSVSCMRELESGNSLVEPIHVI